MDLSTNQSNSGQEPVAISGVKIAKIKKANQNLVDQSRFSSWPTSPYIKYWLNLPFFFPFLCYVNSGVCSVIYAFFLLYYITGLLHVYSLTGMTTMQHRYFQKRVSAWPDTGKVVGAAANTIWMRPLPCSVQSMHPRPNMSNFGLHQNWQTLNQF